MKHCGIRHREGPSMIEVLNRHSGAKATVKRDTGGTVASEEAAHRRGGSAKRRATGGTVASEEDYGGPVPPEEGYKRGGSAKRRAMGGPAQRLTRGEPTGQRGGSNPSHMLTRGDDVGGRKAGGAMKRAMGGVGKLRHS